MHTILGAGGAIGNELARELLQRGKRVRLVGRHPEPVAGVAEVVSADVTDAEQAKAAVAGSTVVYLTVGLPYDVKIWEERWPRIMRPTLEACQQAGAKLIFFDNVYAYGNVNGLMAENTPFHPCSRKGEIRAQIATALLDEIKAGNLTALIARAADFYGPNARTAIPNVLIFDPFAKRKKASWLVNDRMPHSFTFTPDAAKSLVLLADSETSWNQTWHVPTAANPPTGREFIEMAAKAFNVPPKYRVLGRLPLKMGGWFDTTMRELSEMLYQNDSIYLFDSSKFERAFNFKPTPYAEGIKIAAAAYGMNRS